MLCSKFLGGAQVCVFKKSLVVGIYSFVNAFLDKINAFHFSTKQLLSTREVIQ
jgi:hypothetical protein